MDNKDEQHKDLPGILEIASRQHVEKDEVPPIAPEVADLLNHIYPGYWSRIDGCGEGD